MAFPKMVSTLTGIAPERVRSAVDVVSAIPKVIKSNADFNRTAFDQYAKTQYFEDAKKWGGATGNQYEQAQALFKELPEAERVRFGQVKQEADQKAYQENFAKQTELQRRQLGEQLASPGGLAETQFFPRSQVRRYVDTPEEERGQLIREALVDIPGAAITGWLSGRTMGITDVAIDKLTGGLAGRQKPRFDQNQYIQNASNFVESTAKVISGFAGAAPTYGAIAGKIGEGIRKIPVVGKFAASHPVFTSYALQNVGEEMFEASVRKGTGQEYGVTDFMLGMLMGVGFQGTSDILKKIGNRQKVTAIFNKGLQSMEEAKGAHLTKPEVETAVMNMPLGNGVYGRDLFNDRRGFAMKTGLNDPMGNGKMTSLRGQPMRASATDIGVSIPAKPELAQNAGIVDEALLNSQIGANVYDELSISAAGKRFSIDGEQGSYGTTFPDWIPGHLRKTPLVNKVKEALLNNYLPKGKAQLELYDVVKSRMEKTAKDAALNSQEALDNWGKSDQKAYEESILKDKIPAPIEPALKQEYDLEAASQKYLEKLKKKQQIDTKGWASDMFNKLANSDYLKKFGEEGEQLHAKILAADKQGDRWIGANVEAKLAPAIKKMSKEDMDVFVALAKGDLKTTDNKRALNLFNVWDEQRKQIAGLAQQAGLKIKGPDGVLRDFGGGDNYLPKAIKQEILDAKLKTVEGRAKIAKEMVANGSFKTIDEAGKILDRYTADRKSNKFGNLEYSRIKGLPEYLYETDYKKILTKYAEGAYRRLADAEQFGGQDQILDGLLASYRKKGGDVRQLRDVFDVMAGLKKYDGTAEKFSRYARMYQGVTKLGLAAIGNISDIVKPIVKFGAWNTLRGVIKNFTSEGAVFKQSAGVTKSNIQRVAQEAGETEFADKFMKFTGFTATEQNLRGIGALAGENYAKQLFKKLVKNPENVFVKRRLEGLGVDVEGALKRGGLSKEELLDVGWESVKALQPIGRQEVPYYWQSPGGKVLTQFKSFAYKQGKFVMKEVVNEAAKGNFAPLLRFAVFGLLIGEEVGDLKAYVRGRKREGTGLNEAIAQGDLSKFLNFGNWKRMTDAYLTIGGVGLASDFISGVLNTGQLGSPLLTFIGGPTFGEMDRIVGAIGSDIGSLAKGDQFIFGKTDPGKGFAQPQILKQALKTVPVAGSMLSQAVFPSKQSYNARTPSLADDVFNLATGQKEDEKAFNFSSSKKKFDFKTSQDKKFNFQTSNNKKFNFQTSKDKKFEFK